MPKFIVCLGDGMADLPIDRFNGKTPLQFAKTPNMDWLAAKGQSGLVHTVPAGLNPGSDVANMGILGYDPRLYYTGRGPIEAASMGVPVEDNQVIFRCNLVTLQDGVMADFTAGHITTEEADAILVSLNAHFEGRGLTFFTGVSYRHILRMDQRFLDLKTHAPHDVTDKAVAPYWPSGSTAAELMALVDEAAELLRTHPVNVGRLSEGKKPVTHIWPWSQGRYPSLPSFKEIWGLTGGIVTAVDLLRGLATLTGLESPAVKGATGFLDTNYEAKVQAGLEILKNNDFLYLHVEAPDECGHMGDPELKVQAIEDFDREIVGRVLDYVAKHDDVHVLVLPDHPTPCALKTHSHAPVPYALYYSGIEADAVQAYDETSATGSGVEFDTPWDLMRHFLVGL
ncbi:MAG: cofactor-independent phosphoglycerate mutase [Candidatus Margulisiibacteriota bacterium]